jgi:hypothetical protein
VLTLSDESCEQAKDNERDGYPWLVINADEVAQANMP